MVRSSFRGRGVVEEGFFSDGGGIEYTWRVVEVVATACATSPGQLARIKGYIEFRLTRVPESEKSRSYRSPGLTFRKDVGWKAGSKLG